MQALKLAGTEQTPQVTLDKEAGLFEFSGRSLTDSAIEFYRPIIAWIASYAEAPNLKTEVSFKMDYMNTASSKAMFDLFALLQSIPNSKVIWYFQDEDEDMEETGDEFASLVKVPFEMRAL